MSDFLVKISSNADNTFPVASGETGATRISVTIPRNAFLVRNSAGQVVPSQTETLVAIRHADVSYLSSIPATPLNTILSNVIDISLQGKILFFKTNKNKIK